MSAWHSDRGVLVTGATGFIGGATARRLGPSGARIRALCRNPSTATELREHGVELVFGDLDDERSLERACDGCDTVIHCAGPVGLGHSAETYRRLIVDGTRRLLAAAERASVSRFVYLSSAAVYRKARLLGAGVEVVGEEAPIGGSGEAYGQAKAEAERLCRAAHDRGFVSMRILRPTFVYGAGDRSFLPLLVSALKDEKLPLVGGGTGRCCLVQIDDLVDMILLAATSSAAHGRAYNVSGPDELTWRSFVERVTCELGLEQPRRVPWVVAYAAGAACEVAKHWGLARTAPLSRAVVRFLIARRVFSMERARDELGFRPRVYLQQGLPPALAALQHDIPATRR